MRDPRWRRTAGAALLALGAGLFVLAYRGPGFRLVRGHGGDVAVTAFLFFVLGLLTRWPWRTRVAVVAAVALATELAQLARLPPRRSLLTDLTIGSTFDPWDLLAYALGLLLAVLVQLRCIDPGGQVADRPG
jgi:hypothetical protein